MPRGPRHGDDDINNRSVGVFLRYGAFTAFIPGDAEHRELTWWQQTYGRELDADVLVAGHHGSRDANSTTRNRGWYEIVTPRALLISANGRQHPFAEVLDHARTLSVPVYCTHTNGDLVVRARRSGAFEVRPERAGTCTVGSDRPAPRSRR
jgi:beta-lactamase superfamily II metal-dependent hydrolase